VRTTVLNREPTPFPNNDVSRIGFWAAVLVAVFAAAFFLIGIFGTPYTAIGHYPYVPATINYTDYAWLYPAFLLAPAFVVLMACIHRSAKEDKKIFSQIGLSFALIYAAIITVVYFTQWTVVLPSILSKETDGLALFTQYDPHGFFVALESLAYLTLNAALLAIVPIFSGGKLGLGLRWLFAVSFFAVVGSFAGLSLLQDNIVVFEVVIIAIDSTVLLATGILLGVLFRRSTRYPSKGRSAS